MIKKFLIGVASLSLAVMSAGCQSTPETANANANSNSSAISTTTAPDNSEITTTNENDVKTETRTFRNNPRVSKVVVTTRDGNRTVKVYSPSGDEKDVSNSSPDVLHATGDAIADAAGWVKDKSLTVADKTVDTSKTVADKTVDTSKTVAEKTADASKTVARKTATGAKTVANKTTTGVKKAGSTIKKIVTP